MPALSPRARVPSRYFPSGEASETTAHAVGKVSPAELSRGVFQMVNFEGALLRPVAMIDFESAAHAAPSRKLADTGTWRRPLPSGAATKTLASDEPFSMKETCAPSCHNPPRLRLP